MSNVQQLEAVFIAELDEDPGDWTLRRIYADFLEDQDRPRDAEFQRWLVTNKKCPALWYGVDKKPHWAWLDEEQEERNLDKYNIIAVLPATARLTAELHHDLMLYRGLFRFMPYSTREKAESDLCHVLFPEA